MVNFGPLAAEIVSLVWGTPTNFNGFRVFAALLHSQTEALNRGCCVYSAGRPSRWALAHISSFYYASMLIYAPNKIYASTPVKASYQSLFSMNNRAYRISMVTDYQK